MSIRNVAELLHLGEQTVRAYRNRFLVQHMASFTYTQPPGRPSQLTQTPRRELAAWIHAGPQGIRHGWPGAQWILSPCQTLFIVLLDPQPYRRTMDASILGNRLAFPPPMRHQDRLAPIAEASVISRFEDLVQLRLFCPRQPDPPHRFPPLVQSCMRGYLKKDARSSAACIRTASS